MNHVIVWDPSGKEKEGTAVPSIRMNELRSKGVATLPCIPDLFALAACSGFSMRKWGRGWPLEQAAGLGCPLAIFVPYGAPTGVEWCARLIPGADARRRLEKGHEASHGVIRLAAMESRGNVLRPVLTDHEGKNVVDASRIGRPDAAGGWTVYGRAQLHVQGEGIHGIGLYGFAPGLSVEWVAASLAT
jgi:hypothetical protein